MLKIKFRRMHGYGVFHFPTGTRYKGNFKDGMLVKSNNIDMHTTLLLSEYMQVSWSRHTIFSRWC